MDPQATLAAIRDALADADLITARERAADLDEWLSRGGFAPAGYAEVIDELNTLSDELTTIFVVGEVLL